MTPQSHHHRSTLKQKNKSFKSKHASKGSLKAAAKGKTASLGVSSHSRSVEAGSKKDRLHQQAQKRDSRQRSVRDTARLFSTSSGGGKVPRVVTIIPLLPSVSTEKFFLQFIESLGLSSEELEALSARYEPHCSILVPSSRFKTNILVNIVPALDLYASLDAALVSDIVLLLMSSVDEVQTEGESILRALQGQAGNVHFMPCVQFSESQSLDISKRSAVQKSLLSFTRYFFPGATKVYSNDSPNDSLLLARAVCETLPSAIQHPEGRSWLIAEGKNAVRWEPSPEASNSELGTLYVTGTVRGGCMSADRLVHLPGYGDFQIAQILSSPLVTRGTDPSAGNILSSTTETADDLTSHNVPDLLANEQTWPTEEEMASAPAAQAAGGKSTRPKVKRVPKGTSAYQAAWIVDDDDASDELNDDSDGQLDDFDSADGDDQRTKAEEEEMEEIELDEREQEHHDMAPEEEEKQYEAYLLERERAQKDDMAFPDEVDTPRHIAARTRFQRYRGMRSFRTSPWDPYENLPLEYGEIFQFENFNATRRRVEAEGTSDGVEMGTRVTLVLKQVPRAASQSGPLIVHGLLRHEHKQTVLHFVVQRNTEFTEPVRAKDPLVLCAGPRRYLINPLFSQHVRGGGKGVNNVHKTERFLRHGAATVVSTFGPVCFGKAPCLLLRPAGDVNGSSVPDLVAMGSFMSSDPTRIIAKRIVLTGHPFKVHKKTATIRYMFFDRDDVSYFQSVELHTKYGRTGHIKEALGTHGYFKAHFDGPIQQMDTVCMNLYKRQFPKRSTPLLRSSEAVHVDDGMDVE